MTSITAFFYSSCQTVYSLTNILLPVWYSKKEYTFLSTKFVCYSAYQIMSPPSLRRRGGDGWMHLTAYSLISEKVKLREYILKLKTKRPWIKNIKLSVSLFSLGFIGKVSWTFQCLTRLCTWSLHYIFASWLHSKNLRIGIFRELMRIYLLLYLLVSFLKISMFSTPSSDSKFLVQDFTPR